MKRAVLLTALLLSAAGYVFLQTASPSSRLASLMPSDALLYLEAPDFRDLLRDWDTSKVKSDWLGSANYAVFSRSNLFRKLQDVYGQYGEATGFIPDLKSVGELAGADSALALYGIRDVEFLYISRVADGDLMKSQLWAVREKFEQRQAGGVPFYLRTDPASKRTVAFAFAKGYLFLATRDDLVAQALELAAGAGKPSIAADRWYHESVAAAPKPGELRLVMNLEALVKSDYFRSYWLQRNASTIRRYWAGVADVQRSGNTIVEDRVFLSTPESGEAAPAATNSATVNRLLALVPPDAGMYRATRIGETSEAAALIVQKLIGPQSQHPRDWRDAPSAASPDSRAGSEGDLETRIDEQPLPSDAGTADSVAAVRALVNRGGGRALVLVQSSALVAGTFMQTPAVIVLEGAENWDRDAVRSALTAAGGNLWSTSGLGARWVGGSSGRHAIERFDGLGTLIFADLGPLLFLSNDARLLTTVLDRAEARLSTGALTYAAGFRHLRERSHYERMMAALDFVQSAGGSRYGQPDGAPAFFSGNLASLSRVLSSVAEIRVTEEERGATTRQTVQYQMAR